MKKTFSILVIFYLFLNSLFVLSQFKKDVKSPQNEIFLPEINSQVQPGTRWWWMGSAVDEKNLTCNLVEYAKAGIGSVEITPIYGVQNQESKEIAFLSERWMKMYKHTLHIADSLNMRVDMNTGTGWPFGGPVITEDLAASKLVTRVWKIDGGKMWKQLIVPEDVRQNQSKLLRLMAFSGTKVIELTKRIKNKQIEWQVPPGQWQIVAAFNGKTFQQVKRAAPGGEGLVMDHFSSRAVDAYLLHFEKAFQRSGAKYPSQFFNDSYEVYGADWTELLFEEFYKRRGYKLENHLLDFISGEQSDLKSRLISDYRQTLSELLLINFTQKWTNWANAHGSKTRNQAHGSPANLIDLYAAVDVPECEGFGLSDFQIPGLRKDSLTRKNDADLSMLKYASSAAHITGKPLVSSETFTWLTEHFRTSLSQCKPDVDLMLVSGVNQLRFHGTTYSPKEAPWPGWLFYASVNMSPTNSIWKDAPAMFDYIARCQSYLQKGKPDNDFLLYLPVYDVWHKEPGRLLQFDIHSMEKRMPEFIEAVHQITRSGYDVDYVSDQYLLNATVKDGQIKTIGGSNYKALILPAVHLIPLEVMEKITELIRAGAQVIFTHHFPNDVPGFSQYNKRKQTFNHLMKSIVAEKEIHDNKVIDWHNGKIISGNDVQTCLSLAGVTPEKMRSEYGLSMIRRKVENGYVYFVSCLKKEEVNAWIPLAVDANSVLFINPLNGISGKAKVRQVNNQTEVYLHLSPGESLIMQTTDGDISTLQNWRYSDKLSYVQEVNAKWKLSFQSSTPNIQDTFEVNIPTYWTNLNSPELNVNCGTGTYESEFELEIDSNKSYALELEKVRESAVVFINDKKVDVLWSVPFKCDISDFVQQGKNKIRIDVTNLPANRISQMDRDQSNWRIFKEINMVNIKYQKSNYAGWSTMESGLSGKVFIKSYNQK